MPASRTLPRARALTFAAFLLASSFAAGLPAVAAPASPLPLEGHGHASGGETELLSLTLTYTDEVGVRGILSNVEARVAALEDTDGVRVTLEVEDALMLTAAEAAFDLDAGVEQVATFQFVLLLPGAHALTAKARTLSGSPSDEVRGWVRVPDLGAGLLGPATFSQSALAPRFMQDAVAVPEAEVRGTEPVAHDGPDPLPVQDGALPLEEDLGNVYPIGAAPQGGLGASSAEGGSTFEVRGCWLFKGLDDLWYRQRWASWAVFDAGPGDDLLLAGGITGADGCFQSPALARYEAILDPRDVYVRFMTCNGALCTRTETASFGPDKAYAWKTAVANGAQVPDVHHVGSWGPGGESQAAGRLFQYVNNAWGFGVGYAGFDPAVLGSVNVLTPTFSTLGACMCNYNGHGLQIYLNTSDSLNPDTSAHEYGHWTMRTHYGAMPPGSGGAHSWCDNNQNPGLAWSEGYASFYAVRANYDLGQAVPPAPGADGDTRYAGSTNLESWNTCKATFGENEVRVARTLWDLRDSAQDGFDWGAWNLQLMMSLLIEDCTPGRIADYYNQPGCSWLDAGYNKCHFIRAAFQNGYDYNFAPSATLGAVPNTNGWVRGSVPLSATSADIDGECDTDVWFHVWQSAPCSPYGNPVDFAESGYQGAWDTTAFQDGASFYVCARANDTMEQSMAVSPLPVRVDNADPFGLVLLSGTLGGGGWYRGAVTATLLCDDAHSGVATRQTSVDFGPFQPYTGPVVVGQQGGHGVLGRCTDLVGNIGQFGANFLLDSQAPISSAQLTGTQGVPGWFRSAVTVALACDDPGLGSGCAYTEYRVDGGPWTDYTGPFQVTAQGGHNVVYKSTDVAGHVEAQKVAFFAIDTIAPALSFQLQGEMGDGGWLHGPALVTIACQDAVSVALFEYKVSLGDWQPYETPIALSEDGVHLVSARCQDFAGNTDLHAAIAAIDQAAPTLVASVEEQDDDLAVIWWSASDALSGLTGSVVTETSLDGGPWGVVCDQPIGGNPPAEEGACLHSMGDPGTYCWRVTVRDLAGNAQTVDAGCIVNIDPQ